jgi:hypothetical protein
MEVNNLQLRDYTTTPYALASATPTSDPATISFDVVWNGPVTRRLNVRQGSNGNPFAGEFEENQATVTWSGRNTATGFQFTSDQGNFATSVDAFAELGRERNGTFVREGDDDPGAPGPQGGRGASPDQAFTALALLGDNSAVAPVSAAWGLGGTDRRLRESWDPVGPGQGQPLSASNLKNGIAGPSAEEIAPAIRTGRDGAVAFVSDPAATSLVTEIGLQGEDLLFR